MAQSAPVGSPRWWRRLLTHLGMRVLAFVLVIVAIVKDRISGPEFWFLVAAEIAIVITMLPYLWLCVVALRDLGRLERTKSS